MSLANCSAIMPHLTHSDEQLFAELMPSIRSLYNKVFNSSPKYTLDDAISDAWEGYIKAKDHDNKPPSIAGKIIKCPKCHHDNKMPEIMESDNTAIASNDRTFNLKCTDCGSTWEHVVRKSQFSTCVYHFMRGEIQRGARDSRRCGMTRGKKSKGDFKNKFSVNSVISIDTFSDNSDHICKAIAIDNNQYGISNEAKRRINAYISKLPERHQEVICRMFGFEYHGEIMGEMTQAQIADTLGITRQRICAIINSAFEKLRQELKECYDF